MKLQFMTEDLAESYRPYLKLVVCVGLLDSNLRGTKEVWLLSLCLECFFVGYLLMKQMYNVYSGLKLSHALRFC